jgi:hypothetical protein
LGDAERASARLGVEDGGSEGARTRGDDDVFQDEEGPGQVHPLRPRLDFAAITIARPSRHPDGNLARLALAPLERIFDERKTAIERQQNQEPGEESQEKLGCVELKTEDVLEHATLARVKDSTALPAAHQPLAIANFLAGRGR